MEGPRHYIAGVAPLHQSLLRIGLLVGLLPACLEITTAHYENPCDPRNGGVCDGDAQVLDSSLDAAREDAHRRDRVQADRGKLEDLPPRDAALPQDRSPPPDASPDARTDASPGCPESGFSQPPVFDCQSRIEGLCAYEFNIAPDFLTCDSFCEQIGQRCSRAWFAHSMFFCRPVQEDTCAIRVQEMICGCAPG